MSHEDPSRLHTRPSLLLRIRDSGDAEAWRTFVDLYAPLIYGYARRRGLQDADAADVTQEVLTQVSRSIRSFEYRPKRGQFRSWLGRVTHSKIERWRRRRDRTAELGLEDDWLDGPPSEGEDAAWTELFNAEVLRVALERIRPQFESHTWQGFELTWLQNRAAADAAREMDRPVSFIYVAKSRVLQRLREELLMLAEDIPLFVPLA